MFCWGGTLNGELGLGGLEHDQIYTPQLSSWSQSNNVVYAACGENHTLFLTKDGKIYSCGSNDFGQLGHNLPAKRPQLLGSLESYKMIMVACGVTHSVAVNEWGQVFSWGAGDYGQLGLGVTMPSQPTPKITRELAVMQVSQIACGHYHTLALMNNGDLYSWGLNENGQLGLGLSKYKCVSVNHPSMLKSVVGIPFSYIACGGYHSFAVTKSGAVYGWGKNQCGQLGLNDKMDKAFPTLLKNFRSIPISKVVCGEDFSVFLSYDGGVFACGANRYGQLGHGDNKDEWLPKKIVELMGLQVVQVACGRRHLLVATSSGRLQACGLAGSGQLGMKPSAISYVAVPRIINLQSTTDSERTNNNLKISRIFAGGDRCFATLLQEGETLYDSRIPNSKTEILTYNYSLLDVCKRLNENDPVEQDLLCYLETIFKSITCLNASFLTTSHYNCNIKNSGVDIDVLRDTFLLIYDTKNITVKEVIFQCVTENLMKSLNPNPPDVEALRCFLTLPMYHEMLNAKNWLILQMPFAKAITEMKPMAMKILRYWYSNIPKPYFQRIIEMFKCVIVYYLNVPEARKNSQENFLLPVLKAMAILHDINKSNSYLKRVQPEAFYIDNLEEIVDIRQDYVNWLSEKEMFQHFYLCNYPFLFGALCKTSLLELDQAIQMHAAMNQATSAAFRSMLRGGLPPSQYLYLTVSRNNIVADTINELAHYKPEELKKPLKCLVAKGQVLSRTDVSVEWTRHDRG